MAIDIKSFFDEDTFSFTHVVTDKVTAKGVVIDSVLNFDPASGKTTSSGADEVAAYVVENNIDIQYILETHVHADHITASPHLQQKLGGKTGIGEGVTLVQKTFVPVFNIEDDCKVDGSQFDMLLKGGDVLELGDSNIKVMHTPGHTPACVSYVIDDAVFVGDTFFMPDFGTARTDFPGGDAKTLCASLRSLLALPDATRMFMCHDYAPGGREYKWETSVEQQKQDNIHLHEGVSDEEFVTMRQGRDKSLGMPRLILPAVQINLRAGHMPTAEKNGVQYLKLPLNQF